MGAEQTCIMFANKMHLGGRWSARTSRDGRGSPGSYFFLELNAQQDEIGRQINENSHTQ